MKRRREIFSVILFVISVAALIINETTPGSSQFFRIGFPIAAAIIFLIGSAFYSFKGFKENRTVKKYAGLVIFILCLTYLIIIFVTDAKNILSVFK